MEMCINRQQTTYFVAWRIKQTKFYSGFLCKKQEMLAQSINCIITTKQLHNYAKMLGFRWELINSFTTTTTVLWLFLRDHMGEPVPEENFWTLCCKGRLTEADTQTTWLGATPSGLTSAHLHHPIFLPDALPATEPTVSKHWRQLSHSD